MYDTQSPAWFSPCMECDEIVSGGLVLSHTVTILTPKLLSLDMKFREVTLALFFSLH